MSSLATLLRQIPSPVLTQHLRDQQKFLNPVDVQ